MYRKNFYHITCVTCNDSLASFPIYIQKIRLNKLNGLVTGLLYLKEFRCIINPTRFTVLINVISLYFDEILEKMKINL